MAENNEGSQLPVRYEGGRALAPDFNGHPVATFDRFEPAAAPLQDYLGLLLRRKWTVVIAAAAIFGVTCLFTATSPRIYEATATMLVTEAGGGSARAGQGQMPPMMAEMAAPDLETHAALIQGKSTADATADWLKKHGGPNLSASALRQSIRAAIVPKTHLVKLSARARTPKDAQTIANAGASAYADMNRRRAQGSSESASRYLGEQLTISKDNLTSSEEALRSFKESTHTVAQDASAADLLAQAASLHGDLDKTSADLVQAQARMSKVRTQLGQQNRSIAASQVRDNTVVQQLRAKLVDLEGQRLVAQSQYTSAFSAPLGQIDDQIRIIKGQLDAEIRNVVRSSSGDLGTQQALVSGLIQGEAEVAALQARKKQTQAQLKAAERELQRIPARQVTLARLQRQVDVAQNIYSGLLTQSQEIEVGRVMALGNTDVVELADAPALPVKPNVPLNLAFGLLFGLAVGVGLALVLDQLDDTIRGEEDVVRYADAPVLGAVPILEAPDAALVLTSRSLRGRAIDAYRGLRVNLGFVTPGAGGHTVLVTSPGPQEGKTTTALNLAIAAAQSGRRVVLVDSDLRRPSLHRLLSLNGLKGLSETLVGQAAASEVLQGIPDISLRVISSGARPPNPTDLLDSDEMRHLVAGLRKQADLIIFDSPPLLSAADGLVLASLSDAVLMVCIPGLSHRRALQRAKLLLGQIGHTVSGVVLNKVERRQGYGYYGYYYGYYGGYERSDEGDAAESGDGVEGPKNSG